MTCEKARFYYYNLVDQDATNIIGTNENTLYPATNIKSHFTSDTYRSTTASDSVVFDLKTIESVNSVIVSKGFNGFEFNGDLTIEANATNEWSSAAYSTTLTVDRELGIGIKDITTSQSYRFWRISGTGSSYFSLANVFIGNSYILTKNVGFNWTDEDKDLSKKSSNRYGQVFIDENGKINAKSFSIKLMTVTEMETFKDFINYAGTTKPFWFNIDKGATFSPSEEFFAGQFFFKRTPRLTNPYFGFYNTTFSLDEVI